MNEVEFAARNYALGVVALLAVRRLSVSALADINERVYADCDIRARTAYDALFDCVQDPETVLEIAIKLLGFTEEELIALCEQRKASPDFLHQVEMEARYGKQ